jgi:hypothetical protein
VTAVTVTARVGPVALAVTVTGLTATVTVGHGGIQVQVGVPQAAATASAGRPGGLGDLRDASSSYSGVTVTQSASGCQPEPDCRGSTASASASGTLAASVDSNLKNLNVTIRPLARAWALASGSSWVVSPA